MLLKEYKKEYKDYFMFIEVHHSMIKASMHSYTDDDFNFNMDFIDYSVKEVYKVLCNIIDEKVLI
tara:strand:+ start:607 stop:801 length:195 start_codon:yes stop_codon:yes gene_type:complete